MNTGAAVLVLLVCSLAGAYFVRLGLRTVRDGKFRNGRTGELIVGRDAQALGWFLLIVGAAGCVVIPAVFVLSWLNGFRHEP